MASFPLMRCGYAGHNHLNGAELAVWVLFFIFQNEEERGSRCHENRAHAPPHSTEGGVPTPVGNTPSPWKLALWGGPLPPDFTKGSPSNQHPTQRPPSPFWKEPGIFTKRNAGQHLSRSPRGPGTSGTEAPGSTLRGTWTPPWAGPSR